MTSAPGPYDAFERLKKVSEALFYRETRVKMTTTSHSMLMVAGHENKKEIYFAVGASRSVAGFTHLSFHFPPLECFENGTQGKILALNYTGDRGRNYLVCCCRRLESIQQPATIARK